jgi:cation diffusion facilitator CzcD-associated flavoprotein CzcO
VFSRALPVALVVARAASAGYAQLPSALQRLAVAAGAAALAYFARLSMIKDPLSYTAYLRHNRALQQQPSAVPRVCVVGAGFCGLGACSALKRWNIEFDCYEADDQLGGNWYHGGTPTPTDQRASVVATGAWAEIRETHTHACACATLCAYRCGQRCDGIVHLARPIAHALLLPLSLSVDGWTMVVVYETVHIISSRRTTEYKDLPMPEEYGDFPSKDQMLAYLNQYCDHHGIRPHIRFRCAVAHVRLATEGDDGRDGYVVRLADGSERWYGAVIVATGHHWDKRYAGPYPGQDQYTGTVLHSKEYKQPKVLEGQRVLTIGGGNSACDIAVEAGACVCAKGLSKYICVCVCL